MLLYLGKKPHPYRGLRTAEVDCTLLPHIPLCRHTGFVGVQAQVGLQWGAASAHQGSFAQRDQKTRMQNRGNSLSSLSWEG